MDPAVAFAKYVLNLKYADIPSEVVTTVKRITLDSLGVSMAGSSGPGAKEVIGLVKEWGGMGESTVVASGCRVPAVNAAFANGAMVRALDYNETYHVGRTHPSVPIVPAAFAVAERVGKVSGREFIAALASAIDVHCRMSLSAVNAAPNNDWLMPQLHGFLPAAAAAGRLLGLNEAQMLSAFGLAYAQTSGGRQSTAERVLARGLQGAFSARDGVAAALMAQKGITGARDVLEGKFGLYNTYHYGKYDRGALTAGLGKSFNWIHGISFKPYPGCRLTHPSIDAALQTVIRHDILPANVERVKVVVGRIGQPLCEPLEVCRNPGTITEAQYSIPYTVAIAVTRRAVVLNDFLGSDFRSTPVLEIAKKVTPEFDPGIVSKELEPGMVEVTTRGGQVYSERVDSPRGDPDNPMTVEELVRKFRDCAHWAAKPLSRGNLDSVTEMIDNLEQADDVGQVIRLLA